MERIMKFLAPVWPVLIPLAIVVAVMMWQKWHIWRNRKNPDTQVMAEVVDRRKDTRMTGRGVHAQRVEDYYVTFRPLDGGDAVEFAMSEAEYRAYRLGDRGPVTFRTWEFISFRPENRRAEQAEIPVAFAEEERT